jgi:hypothetical protein
MYLSLSYPYSGYALQTAGIRTLWDMGNDVFRYQLEQCPELLDRILTGLLETVENIRYGYMGIWVYGYVYGVCSGGGGSGVVFSVLSVLVV